MLVHAWGSAGRGERQAPVGHHSDGCGVQHGRGAAALAVAPDECGQVVGGVGCVEEFAGKIGETPAGTVRNAPEGRTVRSVRVPFHMVVPRSITSSAAWLRRPGAPARRPLTVVRPLTVTSMAACPVEAPYRVRIDWPESAAIPATTVLAGPSSLTSTSTVP